MRRYLSIAALCALAGFISGCGCSKERKPEDKIPARMKDAAYTNQLVQLHAGRRAVAMRVSAIRKKIEALGKGPEAKIAYAALTNELEKCKAESERLRRDAFTTVRARILKDSVKKGDLKK